jgi:zinc protease
MLRMNFAFRKPLPMFGRLSAMALSFLLPSMMQAQIDRSKAPAPGPAPTVQVGTSKNSTLANGLRVIVVENHKLPIVSVQVRFDHPPVLQGELAGYQDLFSELITVGTARRNKEQIDAAVDRLGAQFVGAADGLFAGSLKKNFPELMQLVYEVIAAPSFPVTEFDKAKTRYASSLKSRVDDPDQIAEVVGRALTFGKGHPYGEVVTEASLAKVKRDHLVAFYERFFRPEAGYIVFVGDITVVEAKALAQDLFGSWAGTGAKPTPDENGIESVKALGKLLYAGNPPVAGEPRTMAFVDRPGSAQSVIKAVFPLDLKPGDPMALSAQVLNTILGGGVFNARLMQNLREARAFTYGAYSSIDADRYCGSFSAGCSVRNEVTDSAVTEMMFEIEEIGNKPVSEAELTLAKNYMAGGFARSLEDPKTIARFALNTQVNELPADYYATYLQRLDTVSIASVQAAAKRLLKPDNTTVLVVGDKAQVANKLAPLSFTRNVVFYDVNGDIYRETAEMPPAGMTAKDVLTNYVKAIGGMEALSKVRSMRKEYTATVQGLSVTLTEQYVQPNKYAMRLGNGPMVLQEVVYDGVRGMKGGAEGTQELLDEELEDARQSAYMFPEMMYQQLDYKALLNGVVEIAGRKCYRVFVQKVNGMSFTEYYDIETGFKTRKTEIQPSEEGNFSVTTDFSDYELTDGVRVPHTIHQNAGMEFHFKAKAVEVNKPIPPTAFSIK